MKQQDESGNKTYCEIKKSKDIKGTGFFNKIHGTNFEQK
jgi:hypothetical protein